MSGRAVGRLAFLAGALAIGFWFLRAAPHDVTLVYGLEGTAARALEVDIRRGGEELRHAEFRFPDGAPPAVRHPVRLPDGAYQLHLLVVEPGGSRTVDRPVEVRESGPIVVPLGR